MSVVIEPIYNWSPSKMIEVVLAEPDNVLAWRLKGIMHNKLGETLLSDLSASEENLLRSNRKRAQFFSKRVIRNSTKNSPEHIRANDILRIVKNN